MRFPPSFLDEIRARVPVSAVVARRVRLKKQGREWRGLSPFQQEKTPSFYVNDQKGFYHCFSSGKHGDQFTFLMETEGLSFPEAVERLAGEAGLPMPVATPEAARREEARRTLLDVMELATAYFEAALQTRAGADARGYLVNRDLRPDTQTKFRIGFAPPERFGLRDHLAAKGVTREEMIATGLLIHGDDIAVPYDRFRDRVMFPIEDMRGRVVAFGGRALSKDAQAKYLNSPETELFHKGELVYNGHRARKAAHTAGRLLVVEGYVDVVMLAQAGILEAVAPLGTALTDTQLDIVWRMHEEPILCFDGDKAGLKAAYRALDIALPKIGPGRTLRFAFLPSGLDPDDLIRQRGRDAMEAVLAAARPFADVLWERETAQADLATPERRAALEARLRGLVQAITDPVLRKYYEDDVRARLRSLNGPAGGPREMRGQSGRPGGRGPFRREQGSAAGPISASRGLAQSRLGAAAMRQAAAFADMGAGAVIGSREANMILVMVSHPALLQKHLEDFDALDIEDPELARLKADVVDAVLVHGAEEPHEIVDAVRRSGRLPLLERLQRAAGARGDWSVFPSAAVQDAETSWLQMVALHRRARTLHRELKAAETAFGLDPSEDNDQRLRAIRRELLTVDGIEAQIDGYGEGSGRFPRTS